MAAAAAARKWRAARRQASHEAAAGWAVAGRHTVMVRVALSLPLAIGAAMILCAGLGFAAARLGDSHIDIEQHAALAHALDEFHAKFGDGVEVPDDAQLRDVARRSGLVDLRFDANPGDDAARNLQSVHDARGRIVGWFSWAGNRGVVDTLDRVWALLAVLGAAMLLCGLWIFRAVWQLKRSLDSNIETVRRLNSQDLLTGLPNHRVMLEHLDRALADVDSSAAVFVLIDLDGLREVNDALGRSGGDAVIVNIAEHLAAGLPAGTELGRFEDDEFAVIARNGDPAKIDGLIGGVRAALLRPVFVDRTWQITASIGVAQAPRDGTTGEEIARRAGLALRAAKREGRGQTRYYEPNMEVSTTERLFLLRELQSAIALQNFNVVYQPVVASEGSAIVGVEALLRWTHPTRGPIPPSVFIPLAEQSGVMSQLGEIVLRRALSDAARWPNLSIAVNLSPVQIRDRWLVDLVSTIMAETGIESSRVVLEVTEGILIDNPQEAQTRLEALRRLGVSIALDDFGTGYSSLNYLQKFPFDRLKIDRAFVASLGTSGNAAAIIQSIVTLGHALGMTVLAEGVENDEQRVLLRLAGCDEMQGFLFAKPVPAAEIDKLIATSQRAAIA
jgi:diguanylate cyclase (GGDEF)-like protein